MIDTSILEHKAKELGNKGIYIKQHYDDIKKNIDMYTKDNENKEKDILELTKAIEILKQISTNRRATAKVHFEKIVTGALQFITQSTDYEFVIQEMVNRNKPSYEFLIKTKVNGIDSLQKPEESNGGGFIDIISQALKYAYLELFKDPKIMNYTVLYDEPGKMISEQMSTKFAEYIKFLGSNYNRQIIMITHNDNLMNVADKTFQVTKDIDGYSKVKELI